MKQTSGRPKRKPRNGSRKWNRKIPKIEFSNSCRCRMSDSMVDPTSEQTNSLGSSNPMAAGPK